MNQETQSHKKYPLQFSLNSRLFDVLLPWWTWLKWWTSCKVSRSNNLIEWSLQAETMYLPLVPTATEFICPKNVNSESLSCFTFMSLGEVLDFFFILKTKDLNWLIGGARNDVFSFESDGVALSVIRRLVVRSDFSTAGQDFSHYCKKKIGKIFLLIFKKNELKELFSQSYSTLKFDATNQCQSNHF